MSASISVAFDIQMEIIKKVAPVRSLIRFRSVSKQWKSLIDSSEFISYHSVHQANRHHLLVSSLEVKFLSLIDDGNRCSRMHKLSHIGFPILNVDTIVLLDSSHGLVCLLDSLGVTISIIILWNPSIQKSVTIKLPYGRYVFGFGVCPEPKIVKLAPIEKDMFNVDYTVELFTLSSGAWTSVPVVNLSLKGCLFISEPVVIDAVIYWVAFDTITVSDRIISFDLAREEFGEVDLPDTLANLKNVSLSKINKCLAVLVDSDDSMKKLGCDVWMMLENGSFKKLFTVKASPDMIHGFMKNGRPIVEHTSDGYSKGELQVYEPSSEHIKHLRIYGLEFRMTSYTESLLLLNHHDSNSTARASPIPQKIKNKKRKKSRAPILKSGQGIGGGYPRDLFNP